MKLRTKFEDEDFKLGEVVKTAITSHFTKDKLDIYCGGKSGCLRRFSYCSIDELLKE